MNRFMVMVVAVVMLAADTGFGRHFKIWNREEMNEKADLVVIAKPISTEITAERGEMPKLNHFKLVGLSTKFEVVAILKGDKTLRGFVLHHYGLDTQYVPANSPQLVPFGYNHRTETTTTPDRDLPYLLYLKNEADGRYAPVDSQVDPAVSSIRKLPPGWKIEDVK